MAEHAKKGLSVLDAVDNLTHMAEIDVNESPTKEQVGEQMATSSWQNPAYVVSHREKVKETFHVILEYLKHLYEKEKGHLRDPEIQRGIEALMVLAREAAQKVDQYTEIFKGEKEESITQIKEYQDLQSFYLTKIGQKFETALPWIEEWSQHAEGELLAMQSPGLKDLEAIRKDREYELFLIRKEDGKPFFRKVLLRHLRLIGEFDKALGEQTAEELFLRIQRVEDHELHLSAKQILRQVAPYVDDYYKEALKHRESPFVASINKAMMALMLASNTRNLMQSTTAKSSRSYYTDFHFYLRQAFSSEESQRLLSHSEQSSRFSHVLLNLSEALCIAFFTRINGHGELIALLRLLIEKGSKHRETLAHTTFWRALHEEDESLRLALTAYPNGPLLKAIDLFRSEQQLMGFDPLAQRNFPEQMYTIASEEMHVSCLRMPCAVHQEYANKATLVAEFKGFLHALERKRQRYLLVNMQDRTSWQEHARATALEGIDRSSVAVMTLPKDTDFYHQRGEYLHLEEAEAFLTQFKQQITSGEQCGFLFPPGVDPAPFLDKALPLVHTLFFGSNAKLTQQQRSDFIEILYQLLLLKVIEETAPDLLSFTCKDAVDLGPAASATLYAFLKIMRGKEAWGQEEKQFFLWMLNAPALELRSRAIDASRFHRMESALSTVQTALDARQGEILPACNKLYQRPFFTEVRVQEVLEG